MWMGGLIIWLLLIGNVAVWSFVDWSMNNGDIRRVAAMFAGCFTPDIMGVRLPECFMIFYDSVPLACVVGASICFLGWKTRFAEFCAGLFFVLSMVTWFGRSISWIACK